jgi:uncharacterized protein (DUF488 family)
VITLYTIGHSNHPIEQLIGLLQDHHIRLLADVRSTPYSRFNPQYNRKALQQTLQAQGIDYIYFGETLGGRPTDLNCYVHHEVPTKGSDFLQEVDYPTVMQKAWFIQGIQNLLKVVGKQPTCILCSEKDPARCHRHHLIARYLLASYPGITIWHILADSSLINAEYLLRRDYQADNEQLSFKI